MPSTPRPSGSSPVLDDATLDEFRTQTDPEADAVVEAHFSDSARSAGQLFGALVRHPDDPAPDAGGDADDPVAAFVAERPPWPDWADPAQVRSGQEFFERWGMQILPGLLLASLPQAYAAAKGVEVLHLTARLATDPRRRVVETAQMTVDAMTVGGLAVGAPGYLTTRRVRLMHAAVRYLIDHDPLVAQSCDASVPRRWCAEWGRPINQEDLLGTLLTFTTVIFDALDRSGVSYARADAEAYLRAWCLVGHFLGIRPDVLPLGLDEAYALDALIRRRQDARSEAGREMTAALVGMAREQMHPRILRGMPQTTMRHLIGDETADLIGVPPGDWTRIFFGPMARLLGRLSMAEQHDRLLRAILTRIGTQLVKGFVEINRGGDRATFALPDHLADRWSIPVAAAGSRPAGGTGTD
ncbi:oxygenase MpaB family protein [Microlunatus ginsengisoli]|uniref:Oxygenase MpaB family protein n=1 Tax=Microlunatus ginsengisoli TaxID=363863 RepID=A0ABP6ZMP0_9ACTN